ncbi:DUF4291 family protein [Streptomyces sp. CoT10]|uniref:DUF4291 family protein n=1 Tax=Streptomyces sp. CoT10 TaxID=2875762 RepID=UPI0027DEDF28|nr:DUF4291 family protein [Streptomyces sp. CoT10]
MQEPRRGIRAAHSEYTITVYQAYCPEIAPPTVRDGRFPADHQHGRGGADGALPTGALERWPGAFFDLRALIADLDQFDAEARVISMSALLMKGAV